MSRSEKRQEHPRLSSEDKRLLLSLARSAIEKRLGNQPMDLPQTTSPILQELRGVFVTLHKRGALRGCIGYIHGIKPLFQAVSEMAVSAAIGDPRFPPVSSEELPELEIEISVLTPLLRIEDASEIQVGQHGIFIVHGSFSGLLLPQVATEYGWDRETFLRQTCLKAGLPSQAWTDPRTELYIFSAEIFSEHQM